MEDGKPMKCIKDHATGIITRVSNEHAATKVRGGSHEYSSKGAWKKQVRHPEDIPNVVVQTKKKWKKKGGA